MRRLIVLLSLAIGMGFAGAYASDSLYERLGEKAGLAKIAGRMLDYATTDDRIKEAFVSRNRPRLQGLLTLFFCRQVGGPCKYPGRSMEEAHAGVGVHDRHFNALVEDLQKAMTDENIPFATQNEFLATLAPLHHDIVKE